MPTEVIKIKLPDGYQLNFEADQQLAPSPNWQNAATTTPESSC
jgi:hypothetical protein